MPFSPPSAEKPLLSHHSPSPGFWAQWQEKPGDTQPCSCKRSNLHCLPWRQRRRELLMIGFIWPIFRRMSEVNSTAINAQLVLIHCLGSHTPAAQSWGTEERLQPWSLSTGAGWILPWTHLATAAASWLLPFAFPALLTPAAPALAGLQPRALGSSQCQPQLPALAVPSGHGWHCLGCGQGHSKPSWGALLWLLLCVSSGVPAQQASET